MVHDRTSAYSNFLLSSCTIRGVEPAAFFEMDNPQLCSEIEPAAQQVAQRPTSCALSAQPGEEVHQAARGKEVCGTALHNWMHPLVANWCAAACDASTS